MPSAVIRRFAWRAAERALDVEFVAQGAEIRLVYTDPTYDEVQQLAKSLSTQGASPGHAISQALDTDGSSQQLNYPAPTLLERASAVLSRRWPRLALAGLMAMVVIGIWIYTDRGLSAKAILEESEKQAISWEFELGTVKHWTSEVETTGFATRPDGKYRSYFWRSNIEGQGASLIVHRDLDGNIEWGQFLQPDGSQVLFNSRASDGKLKIYPGYAELEAAKAGVDEPSRQAIHRYIEYVKGLTDPNKLAENRLNYVRRMYDRGVVSREDRPDIGKVLVMKFQPSSESEIPKQLITFEQIFEVRDIDHMQIGMRNTKNFKDGHTEVTATRILSRSVSSLEEMQNNDFTRMVAERPDRTRVAIGEIIKLFGNERP